MIDLLTAAGMRAIEAEAMASGRASGVDLMERAGTGVVGATLAVWPEPSVPARRAVVLCGPGNNGGDGFVIARLLRERGWEVAVYLLGEARALPPDAGRNHDRWAALGPVHPLAPEACAAGRLAQDLAAAAIVVDALFGTGLTRALPPLPSPVSMLWDRPPGRPPVVAVDVPSGLCADAGVVLGGPGARAVMADLTVTFHRAKRGHLLADGPRHCAALRIVDIGLGPAEPVRDAAARVTLIRSPADDPVARGFLAKRGGHKFDHGHVVVLSGGVGQGGAARLAARSALRVGAGLVTVACPPAALIETAAQLTAVMLRPVADGQALAALLQDARITALCLGPGLGVVRAAEMLAVALPARRATVVDADALTALARDPALLAALHADCVLTPHGGEFARLFPDIAARLDGPALRGPAFSRVDAAREAAARAGCVVLLKGPDTVIAAPDGHCRLQASVYGAAAPWLATAGSGDVLAGLIAGLVARGASPLQAAGTGAWLHAAAARHFGPGLIAEDLPEAIPGVFRSIGL